MCDVLAIYGRTSIDRRLRWRALGEQHRGHIIRSGLGLADRALLVRGSDKAALRHSRLRGSTMIPLGRRAAIVRRRSSLWRADSSDARELQYKRY